MPFLLPYLLLFLISSRLTCNCEASSQTSNWSSRILSMVAELLDVKHQGFFEPDFVPRYTDVNSLKSVLDEIHQTCPNITRVYSIGSSVLGRPLWVLSVGDQPAAHEPGELEVKLIANIHGNEPVGRELLLRLGWLLCRNYGTHGLITLLLDHTQIHLLPSMNPDGFEISVEGDEDGVVGRENKHEVDLNRDFPDQYGRSFWEKYKEPETMAVMNWSLQYPFVLSASIHGGALVAVYPFDGSANDTTYHAATPDDAVFNHLATVYSKAHGTMYSGTAHCDPKTFVHGVSNGNAWYPLFGGMQDWNYLHTGCMEITLELSCSKYPRASMLTHYWNENKYPLLRFVAEAHRALKGFIIDGYTGLPVGNASIHVLGNSHVVFSTMDFGEYWRLLPTEGQFILWASKSGYFDSDRISIDAARLPFVAQTACEQLNFTLWPSAITDAWSQSIDFGIQLNRLPAYFPESTVSAAVRSAVFGDFVQPFALGATGAAADAGSGIVGVQLAIVARGLRRKTEHSEIQPASAIRALPGRARLLILAGLHAHDLVSTEMVIRMLRHYALGLDMLDRHVSHLLSSQIVVFPYLDSNGIERTASLSRSSSDLNDSIPGICLSHRWPSAGRSDYFAHVRSDLKALIRSLRPHLIVALTTGSGPLTRWDVRGEAFTAPIAPLFVPPVSAAGISMRDLLGDLAFQYANGSGLFNRSSVLCDSSADERLSNEPTVSTVLHKQLTDLLASMHQEYPVNPTDLPTIAMAVHISCESCAVPSPQALPELWHRTLNGLTALFHAVRNLSFRGRLLVETSSLTTNFTLSSMLEPGWVPVPSARILVQPAFFFLSHSDQTADAPVSNRSRWVSIPVDPNSGLFCTLLPTGTFLAFAAADSDDTVLGRTYEEVALALSMRPDQNNGRIQIRLQRQVSKIEFHSPADLTERLRQLSAGPADKRCGELRSIGKSDHGEELYVFEMGLGRTSLPPLSTQNMTDSKEDYDKLVRFDDPLANVTDMFQSLFPKVVLFGNLDGSDLLAPQLLTHLVEWLCQHRDNQSTVRQLLASVQLAVIPVPNPHDLSTAWQTTFDRARWDLMDEEVCLATDRLAHSTVPSWQYAQTDRLNTRPMRLWKELIALTRAGSDERDRWWWEDTRAANLSVSLARETKALVSWLRDYQPTALLSFPAVAPSPTIDYGLDPVESDLARQLTGETHEWLRFLGHLMAPGFHRQSSMCSTKAGTDSVLAHSAAFRRRPPGSLFLNPTPGSSDPTQLMALALSLASVSPDLATDELVSHQLQHSPSFPAPRPLMSPVSLALTLCPACRAASPMGVARVWSDFRLPSLLIGLLGHATLTAPGSSGLIGQVVSSTTGAPIPWVRVHLDFVRAELSSGWPDHKGYFGLSLPPGTYRLSFRAQDYLDHSELVKIDALRGPVHRVFRMTPVSALSLSTRIYVLSVAGSLAVLCLCLATSWLCYRFCCRARTPYAMARRAFGFRGSEAAQSSSSKTTYLGEASRGAYRLIPVKQSGGGPDENADDPRKAMLSDRDLQEEEEEGCDSEADLDEPGLLDRQLRVHIRSGSNDGHHGLRRHLRERIARTRKSRGVQLPQQRKKKLGHTRLTDDDEGLEEVDLV